MDGSNLNPPPKLLLSLFCSQRLETLDRGEVVPVLERIRLEDAVVALHEHVVRGILRDAAFPQALELLPALAANFEQPRLVLGRVLPSRARVLSPACF